MTLRDRWFLYWNNVCTKHLVKRVLSSFGEYYCPVCEEESWKRKMQADRRNEHKITSVIYANKQ